MASLLLLPLDEETEVSSRLDMGKDMPGWMPTRLGMPTGSDGGMLIKEGKTVVQLITLSEMHCGQRIGNQGVIKSLTSVDPQFSFVPSALHERMPEKKVFIQAVSESTLRLIAISTFLACCPFRVCCGQW